MLEELKTDKEKIEKEAQLLINIWNQEMAAEWANSQSKVPPSIYPAKQQIYELVKKNQHQKFIKLVSYLKKIDAQEITKPRGLHLTAVDIRGKQKHTNGQESIDTKYS